jgi:hypothetical protein
MTILFRIYVVEPFIYKIEFHSITPSIQFKISFQQATSMTDEM